MSMRSTVRFVPFIVFLFLGSVVFAGAAGARIIYVPEGVPTLELAAGFATADDTIVVSDPALREEAARFEGLFNIVFLEVTPGPTAQREGAGPPGPSNAPCAAEWVEGTVTNAGGAPLPGITVVLFQARTASGVGSITDAAGHYLVCATPGDYAVVFNMGAPNDYLPEVYNNKGFGCGETVTVRPAQSVTVNAGLARAGAISGTVTDGANPLAGVNVAAMGMNVWTTGVTDALGRYVIKGLRGGEYTVRFSEPSRAFEYYDDKGNEDDVRPVVVTAGQTRTGIDAVLSPGVSLSGNVSDGVLPVPNTLVILRHGTSGYGYVTVTDPLGDYSFTGLREGEYAVRFTPPTGLNQWYNGKMSDGAADWVQVDRLLGATGVDVTIKPGGSIRGVVADGGVGFGNAGVRAYDQSGMVVSSASTAFDGTYVIPRLPDGRYRVQATGWLLGHENEWYGGTANPGESPVVTIAGASDAMGVDFDLAHIATGSMSGKMSYEGGECSGLFAPNVMILPDPPLSEWHLPIGIFTVTDSWEVFNIPPGGYRVKVMNSGGTHQEQWYPGVPDFSRSRVVTVPPGGNRGGVDVKLPRSGRFPVPEVFFNTPSSFLSNIFDDVFNMGPGDSHPMSLDLECNKARGVPVDWWLLAFTPLPPPRNVFHFEPGRGWQPGLEVSVQGPCANLDELKIMNMPYFPLGGDVDIYFGLDGIVNGMLDPGTLFYDGMRVHMYK